MILVVILVVAWSVVLIPSLVRRRSEHGDSVSSISHFRRQLRVLEHSSAEPIVLPAYRLHSVGGRVVPPASRYPDIATVPVLAVVGADRLPRPALACLGAEPAGDADGASRRTQVPTDARIKGSFANGSQRGTSRPVAEGELRARARRRRQDTLVVLSLAVVLTFLAGFIPGLGMIWALTLLGALALVAYVSMLVHLRSRADERDRKLRYLRPPAASDRTSSFSTGLDVDDHDFFHDDVAANQASRRSHPARQAAMR